ncbi:MAG: hypothetical protein AB8C84_05390 [Oligoflexales bacterium]
MIRRLFTIFVMFLSQISLSVSFDRVVDKEEYLFFKNLHHHVYSWKTLIDQKNYEDILFLGDKPEYGSHSIGKILRDSRLNFEAHFWSSDLLYRDRDFAAFPFFHQRKINHQERFSFEDKSFDVVMGRRILCHCESRMAMSTCGGIDVENAEMLSRFLSETVRVLNHKRDSFVFLHGLEPKDSRRKDVISECYQQAFEQIKQDQEDLFIFMLRSPFKKHRRFGLYIGRSDFREWN